MEDHPIWRLLLFNRFGFYPRPQLFPDRRGRLNPRKTICSYIFIQFDMVPTPGRYYFNNTGSVEAAGGTIAIYSHNVINHLADKWSTGGYVDIESMTNTEVKGTFNFTAKGDATDTTTTVISQGQVRCGGSIGIVL